MTFHHLRAPRPAVALPTAPQLGPVTLALRAMREAVEAPPRTGPVTDAIRTMRAALPGFDADPDLRALRRALADRIEADLAVLDMLGGDADEEPSLGSLCGTAAGVTFASQTAWALGAGDDSEQENEHGSDDDSGELTLGWCENVGQLALGQNTDDGDATALERAGAGFIRSGHEDDEDTQDAEGNTDDNGLGDDDGLQEQMKRYLDLGGTASPAWAIYK